MNRIEKLYTDITRTGAMVYNSSLRAMLNKNPDMTGRQVLMNLEAHRSQFLDMDNEANKAIGAHNPTFAELYEMSEDDAEPYYEAMSSEEFDKFLEYTAERSRQEEGLTLEQVQRYTAVGKNGKR